MAFPWPFKRRQQPPETEGTRMSQTRRTQADRWMTGSETVYAANQKIANAVASMPVHLYRGNDIADDDPLERLIAYAPNDRMTGYTWRWYMQANVGHIGSAYSLKRYGADGTTVVGLTLLDPARVTPYVIQELDAAWYRVQWENGETSWHPNDDMIIIRTMSAGGETGISQREVLRNTLEYDAKIKTLSLKQLSNVNSGVVISVPTTGLDDKKRREIVQQMLDTYEESDGRAVVLQGGMTATSLTGSSIDPKVLDIEKMTKNRVATVTGVPSWMLGEHAGGHATQEQEMLEFYQLTIQPMVTQWENELNRKLLTWDMVRKGYGFKFDMRALLRADTTGMANKHQMAIRGGWMTINECRAEDNLPPVENGDVLLAARDLQRLEDAVNGIVPGGGN